MSFSPTDSEGIDKTSAPYCSLYHSELLFDEGYLFFFEI